MNCFLHPDAIATDSFSVPCAPGGKIHVCPDCKADPDVIKKIWDKYKGTHAKNIAVFSAPANPRN